MTALQGLWTAVPTWPTEVVVDEAGNGAEQQQSQAKYSSSNSELMVEGEFNAASARALDRRDH